MFQATFVSPLVSDAKKIKGDVVLDSCQSSLNNASLINTEFSMWQEFCSIQKANARQTIWIDISLRKVLCQFCNYFLQEFSF